MMRRLGPAALFLLVCGVHSAALTTCNSFKVNNFNFVNYTGSTITGTTSITFKCPNGTVYSVGLNAGLYGGSVTSRQMNGGAYYLGYEIFSDPGYSINWGNTSGYWVSGTGTGSKQTLTAYLEVPAGEVAGTGGYGDTVTATLTVGGTYTTTTFNINGTVQPYCTTAASSLSFGNYTGSVLNSAATIQAICTNGTGYTIGLNAGTGSGATVSNRSMTGPGGASLHYGLYQNSGHTTIWGNTIGTNTVAGTGTAKPQSFTVYGQIPAGTLPGSGSYADSIVATMTY